MRNGFIMEGLGCMLMIVIIGMLVIPACCLAISDISSRTKTKQTVTETISNGQTNKVTVIEYSYK